MGNDWDLDLAVLPKELLLLLTFMGHECGEDKYPERFTNIDWEVFLELTRHHRIYPYIYNKVKKLDDGRIPPHVVPELRQQYQQNTFHMLRLSAEMDRLSQILSEQGIRVLQLKGPALAADLYSDLSKRTSGDLDVLISIRDLDQVHELLAELAYIKEDYFSTVLNDWTWRHHHVTYFHPDKKIKLEIHWRLNPGPSYEPSFEQLWERRRVSALTSVPIYLLGHEDLFFFLVSHGARHGWSRLRWLADIDRIVKRHMDWEKLVLLLKKHHITHVGGQALILSSRLLDTPLTEAMRTLTAGNRPKRLAKDALFYIRQMIHLHKEPLADDVADYHKRHLFSLMSYKQKLLYFFSFLYPYPMDVEILPLPKNLHFLYFPLRPFLWAWRKTGKHAWTLGEKQ